MQHLIDQFSIIWRALTTQFTVNQVLIKLQARLDGIGDNCIAEFCGDAKADEDRSRIRRGNVRLLKPLQAREFAQRRIAADDSL